MAQRLEGIDFDLEARGDRRGRRPHRVWTRGAGRSTRRRASEPRRPREHRRPAEVRSDTEASEGSGRRARAPEPGIWSSHPGVHHAREHLPAVAFSRLVRRFHQPVGRVRPFEALDRTRSTSVLADPERIYALLSGGNQQKVVFAKWLCFSPKVMVIEDPTSGVDVGVRQAIYDLVRHQASAGVSFVVCSSDPDDLLAVCDRILVLNEGRIVDQLVGSDIEESRLLMAMVGASKMQSVSEGSTSG